MLTTLIALAALTLTTASPLHLDDSSPASEQPPTSSAYGFALVANLTDPDMARNLFLDDINHWSLRGVHVGAGQSTAVLAKPNTTSSSSPHQIYYQNSTGGISLDNSNPSPCQSASAAPTTLISPPFCIWASSSACPHPLSPSTLIPPATRASTSPPQALTHPRQTSQLPLGRPSRMRKRRNCIVRARSSCVMRRIRFIRGRSIP
ncbi:unnamed protein product [Sordaria macrospora k-hell]|uniref:WGS project CABT00000000 data, contig 2.24 n=1 Tax=Sordaria macrospora (strain ATCC MYA-333 / DSM 997 / K(L3346) / K-hell) TaxID=771870 RepID=F7W385_SORMK|nr:uncharacterized protein SMAC_09233 [Sordaria macrospora k-hell]CCC12087.1 unnamed protein product [Sordaria macrospora k-hell]